ncbi:MAG: SIMPL domain-containing protein [Candidatus Aenigmarchaeota archaeon]|nr:SIMPL domain-containing protein [Candidatus Aenigmarchaeota archaeon]
MKEFSYWPFIAAIVVVGLLFFAVQQPKQIILSSDNEAELNRLSVSGDAKLDTPSNMATVFLRTEVLDNDPKVAQDKNAEISRRAINALVASGVDKNDIQTTDYDLQLVREWNPKTEQQEEKGYRAGHTLKVSTMKLDKIGQYLKTAVDAGVNNVQNIQFSLSREKQREIKNAALSSAAKTAQEKADALASSLGVRLGRIVSVSESSFDVYPVPRYYAKEMITMAEAAPPIQPAEVTAQATVNVVFELA